MINPIFCSCKKYAEKHPKKAYLISFTIIFLITSILFYASFWANGKSFIWQGEAKDGLVQHYNSLMYFGEYLRTIMKSIIFDKQLSIPMWDFSLGYGSDVMVTLHYYVFGDPLNLLSAFVKPEYTEYLYMFLILLRIYLAGLSFSCFSIYMKQDRKSTLLGALTYMFCGFVIFAAIRHPYFINPMIYLPLLLVGVEKIFGGKSPVLFIVMVAISIISNFYFFYMLCLLVIIYVIFRYFMLFHDNHVKRIFGFLLKFTGYGLIGIAISAIVFIPVISFFLGTSRSQDKVFFDTLYSLKYYAKNFLNFTSFNSAGYWSFTSFSALSLLSIFMLYIKSGRKSLKGGFLFLTLCLCIPYLGYIFHGFSYLSNRWCFGYAFIVSLIVVITYKDLLSLSNKDILLLGMGIIAYILIPVILRGKQPKEILLSYFFIVFIYIIFVIKQKIVNLNSFMITIIVGSVIIISVSSNAYQKYSPSQLNYIKEFGTLGEGYKKVKETRAKSIRELNDNSFYRYDETSFGDTYLINTGTLQNENSLMYFFSLGSGNTTDYFMEMKNRNALSSKYNGLDQRTGLNALASTKYFVYEPGQEPYIPYGFNKEVFSSNEYTILESDYVLPLGYTYGNQISREKYEELTPLQKQQALMQSVVVDGDVPTQKGTPNFSEKNTSFELLETEGIEQEGDRLIVTKKDAYLILSFEGEENSELYFSLNNFEFFAHKNKKGNYVSKAQLKIDSSSIKKSVTIRSNHDTYYNGTVDYLVNMGYSEDKRNTIKIDFTTPGEYSLEGINLYHLPMNDFSSQVEKLKEDILTEVQIDNNKIDGHIDLDEDKFLCLSIPYSEGWKIYVDGREEELYRANTMFMGIPLKKGEHEIKLKYTTPYIKLGAVITCIGLVSLGMVIYIHKKTKIGDEL